MEILSLPALTPVPAPAASVVALGFFDGVHTAHAAVLAKAAAVAAARGLPLLRFTFSAADAPKGAPLLSGDEERAALFFPPVPRTLFLPPFRPWPIWRRRPSSPILSIRHTSGLP